MPNYTVVAIDTGNKNIKVPHAEPFTSGLIKHGPSAPPVSAETLKLDGNYFSLTETRIPAMFDKTKTEDFYILTLFGIARELLASSGAKDQKYLRRDICLATGLPPTHLQELKEKYVAYFGRSGKRVCFEYNDVTFDIRIGRVEVFPQGYAAMVPYLGETKNKARSYIIDIGGYTTDVIKLKRGGEPDLEFCESFNTGIIKLFDKIERTVRNSFRVELDDYMVDSILRGQMQGAAAIQKAAKQVRREFASTLIHSLAEKGVDLTLSYPVFIGGGASLLKEDIITQLECDEYKFVDDVRANAQGYELLAKAKLIRESRSEG